MKAVKGKLETWNKKVAQVNFFFDGVRKKICRVRVGGEMGVNVGAKSHANEETVVSGLRGRRSACDG